MAKRNIAVIKNEAEENWRKIVTKTLDEVYGENLVNFSAKGKNSKKRPGIHNRLYKGLYGWAKEKDSSIIQVKFAKCINDHCSNQPRSDYEPERKKRKKTDNTAEKEIEQTRRIIVDDEEIETSEGKKKEKEEEEVDSEEESGEKEEEDDSGEEEDSRGEEEEEEGKENGVRSK
ncbi:glutamic acid-rich protein-like [Microplitis demolitor]|uniref:glutamic acid-rich protein-like n=1 Tax=Microplitis demolitor TaxID=69319 RepID=UPI0004CCAECA|nr:glutamic acid-rich protein-like [Microplitis demolitor]